MRTPAPDTNDIQTVVDLLKHLDGQPDRDADLAIHNLLRVGEFPYRWSSNPLVQNQDGSGQKLLAVYDFPEDMGPDEQDYYLMSDRSVQRVPDYTSKLDPLISACQRLDLRWDVMLADALTGLAVPPAPEAVAGRMCVAILEAMSPPSMSLNAGGTAP